MDVDLEMAIIGGCIALGTIIITIFLIRRLCDLIIFILFSIAILTSFGLIQIGGYSENEIYGTVILMGILMPIITLPVWSISKILRGNEDDKITKFEYRIKSLEQTIISK